MVSSNAVEVNTKSRQWPKRLAIALIAIAVVAIVGVVAFLVYASDYYHDLDTEGMFRVSTAEVPVEQGSNYLAFGNADAECGIVFYPGAKVEYSAYSPIMRELAEEGYLCIVVQMPFNFAFFDINAAGPIMEQYPQVSKWWIGGHSLGGSMAANYAASHSVDFEGVILLGSYSADDLSQTDLSVYSLYGSNDEVLNYDSLASSRALLPASSIETVIEGGNHAYFGNYGEQEGDGKATITPEEQWTQTVQIILEDAQASK